MPTASAESTSIHASFDHVAVADHAIQLLGRASRRSRHRSSARRTDCVPHGARTHRRAPPARVVARGSRSTRCAAIIASITCICVLIELVVRWPAVDRRRVTRGAAVTSPARRTRSTRRTRRRARASRARRGFEPRARGRRRCRRRATSSANANSANALRVRRSSAGRSSDQTKPPCFLSQSTSRR